VAPHGRDDGVFAVALSRSGPAKAVLRITFAFLSCISTMWICDS